MRQYLTDSFKKKVRSIEGKGLRVGVSAESMEDQRDLKQ